ncbi:MAG: sulfite exporter TauE/SafE family protein [Gemmatimonadota bacterium]|nr:MAG: sulfite exporter TauE/SafE family protein [Gemmatimonadota bacterium]
MWIAYATALALGAAHALEVDHMVAVSAFIGNRPRVRTAVSFGVRWGLGHSLVVLVVGGTLVVSGVGIPEGLGVWAELGVGIMLVALGIWALRAARRLHLHRPRDHAGHAHLHAHSPGGQPHQHSHSHADPGKRHRHLSTLVGAIHGLAGTAPVVALIPVTVMPNTWAAIGYLAAFGVGTVGAMSVYAALAAVAATRASASVGLARAVALVTAFASFGVGMWWIVRAARELSG